MPNFNVPDMIYDNPTQNDLPAGSTPLGGRLMSSAPHVDGVLFFDPADLDRDSANLALIRNAKGDWSLNRTAAGAETYNVRVNLGQDMYRKGETYNLGLFGSGAAPAAPSKGIQILDVFVVYTVGVVALTSATIRVGKSVFANNVALAQTDILAATGLTLPTQANPYVVTTPVVAGFITDDTSSWEIETVFVMANTGTLRIYGIGAHVNFNFN